MAAASVFRPGLFRGKYAVVTGGAGGIGQALVRELAGLGANVVIASRSQERLDRFAEEINGEAAESVGGQHGVVMPIRCDVRKEEEVESLVAESVARFGPRGMMLVNNGGGQFPSPASKISRGGWHAVVDTNLNGTFLCCRAAFNQCMKQHGGAIVSVVADVWKGMPGMSHTGAARAGVVNLTKSLAVEWAENGVRINAVSPGIIFSESAAANYTGDHRGLLQSYATKIPAQRLGTPEEVSAAITFLLSPGASYISGSTLNVDGGSSLYTTAWPVPKGHGRFPGPLSAQD